MTNCSDERGRSGASAEFGSDDAQSQIRTADSPVLLNDFNDALALHRAGKLVEAEAAYKNILAVDSGHAATLVFMGVLAKERGCPSDALRLIDSALERDPQLAVGWVNRGVVLLMLGRPEDALASIDRALEINSDFTEALSTRGAALRDLRRPQEAIQCYQRARMLKPDLVQTYTDEGLCRLLIGDFAHGWRMYENRWKQIDFARDRRDYPQPRWLGQDDISERTILLWAEQGFGDTIQFCRYVNLLVQREAKVILEVHRPLKALLGRLAGSVEVFGWGEPLPPFDFHCPLMSLPLAFKTTLETIPADGPYLSADPQKVRDWSSRLGSANKRRVGLVWSGSPGHTNDAARSIPLAELLGSLGGVEASFVSLQKELRPHDQAVLAARPEILHFGESLRDFDDTAALIQAMDLVISVDTSVAHLAGALGKPVWILLPYVPDWRWLLDREDSPWYPTARLFRQPRLGDWECVLGEVAGALRSGCAVDIRGA